MSLTGKAVIGRYADHQPLFDFSANTKSITAGGNMYFKNIAFKFNTNGVTSGSFTGDSTYAFEDCTITTTTNHPIFFDDNATFDMANIYMKNCVCIMAGATNSSGVFSYQNTKKTSATRHAENFVFQNNVLCYTGEVGTTTAKLFNFYLKIADETDYLSVPSLKITLTNNTIYGYRTHIIDAKNPDRLNLEYNACEGDVTTGANALLFQCRGIGTVSSSTSTSSYNYGVNTEETGTKAWGDVSSTYTTFFTRSGNNLSNKTFSGAKHIYGDNTPDAATGYIPIDPTVVTNGAGATYSTKLWRTWE